MLQSLIICTRYLLHHSERDHPEVRRDIGRQSAYRGIQMELSAPRSYPTGADRSRTTLRQAACGWRHSRTGRIRRQDNNLQVPADAYEG